MVYPKLEYGARIAKTMWNWRKYPHNYSLILERTKNVLDFLSQQVILQTSTTEIT
tara:strand:+ start:497 stop:661 length:165 start_codon:yes stop_codon:yes gene_type:complete